MADIAFSFRPPDHGFRKDNKQFELMGSKNEITINRMIDRLISCQDNIYDWKKHRATFQEYLDVLDMKLHEVPQNKLLFYERCILSVGRSTMYTSLKNMIDSCTTCNDNVLYYLESLRSLT